MMRTHIRTLGTGIATAVFSVSLLAVPAFAATVPQPASIASVERPTTDRHARFCAKMDHLLKRLVEKGVITREQAARILAELGCTNTTTPPAAN
jgi:hypothetical protein